MDIVVLHAVGGGQACCHTLHDLSANENRSCYHKKQLVCILWNLLVLTYGNSVV